MGTYEDGVLQKVRDGVERTLTVRGLIELLECFDDDLPVVFSRPSGDYWHTNVCDQITYGEIESVTWSDYHDSLRPDDPGNWDVDDNNDPIPAPSVEAVVLQW